ncbi:hypothetical protein HDV00_011167 [Rhizophlyctis rosea]|nr:hypothetical protein HDV00_011167 [Rhizophlyctis rosea]
MDRKLSLSPVKFRRTLKVLKRTMIHSSAMNMRAQLQARGFQMKLFTAILAVLAAAALTGPLAAATNILLPLYLYPSAAKNAWNPVYDAINATPDVNFYIIVNPDSGPGNDTYPNDEYKLGLATLNTFRNVRLLGYVHTTYAADSPSEIKANITKYAAWSDYEPKNIAVRGIFFDEVSATSENLPYYKDLSDYAYHSIPHDNTYVALNPGTNISVTAYYDLADYVVVYECPFEGDSSNPKYGCQAYRNSTTINQNVNRGFQEQAAFLIRSFTGGLGELASSVAIAARNNVGCFYATATLDYEDVSLLGHQAAVVKSVSRFNRYGPSP